MDAITDSSKIYIHIGAPRCGTCFLRNKIFPHIKNVKFSNKLNNSAKTDALQKLSTWLAHMGDGNELSCSIDNQILKNLDFSKKILISEEHFIWSVYHLMGNIGSRALLLKSFFPNAKIILSIRRQPEYFISVYKYLQTIETSHLPCKLKNIRSMLNLQIKPLSSHLFTSYKIPIGFETQYKFIPYDQGNTYFNRDLRSFISADLSWMKLYSIYANLFGEENILIIPQESLKTDFLESTVLRLSNFIGESINIPMLKSLKRDNTTENVKSPFDNDSDRQRFTNHIQKLVHKSNIALNKHIKDLDLNCFGYLEQGSHEPARIVLGKQTEHKLKINFVCQYWELYLRLSKTKFSKLITNCFDYSTRKLKNALRNPYLKWCIFAEQIQGLDFSQMHSCKELGLNPKEAYQYESSKLFEIRKILKKITIPYKTIAIDFGSGKGSICCCLAKLKQIDHVYGIEISKELCNIAKANVNKKNLTDKVTIHCENAINLQDDILNKTTLFYFYNPFPESVLKKVINAICKSLKNYPRDIILVYFNPVGNSILEQSTMFLPPIKYNNLISNAPTYVYRSK